MEMLLAYFAGLLTLINPCVLPVLPMILSAALSEHRLAPVAIAIGLGVSFVTVGTLITAFGFAIGLYQEQVSFLGAILMMFFGAVLLVPRMSHAFAVASSGVATWANSELTDNERPGLSLMGHVFAGMLLGVVWSPCIGPTLGGAISLASQGEQLGMVMLIMASFAIGVGTLVVLFAYASRRLVIMNRMSLVYLGNIGRIALGLSLLIIGAAVSSGFIYRIEAWFIENMPVWMLDLSVAL